MWLCQVWSKWAHPWAPGLANNLPLLEAKETKSQAPCTWCPEPRDQPLGAQRPQEKEPGRGQAELTTFLQGKRHGPHPPSLAAPGFATNLPSQETCHLLTGQTDALLRQLLLSGCSPQAGPFIPLSPSSFLVPAYPPELFLRGSDIALLFPVLLPSFLLSPIPHSPPPRSPP